MLRSTAPRLVMALLVVAAVPLMVTGARAVDPPDVWVADFRFEPALIEVVAGKTVTWELHPQASAPEHSITLDANGDKTISWPPSDGDVSEDLHPGTGPTTFSYKFEKASAEAYNYFCRFHPANMRGQVLVKDPPPPPPPTTTTTAPPPTTTTTAPAPTTTTTRPPATTTTTRPPATTTTTRPPAPTPTTPTTQPPASASSDKPDTTSTTAKATTTTGKPTTTTGKKKPASTTTTNAPETTTTSALPAEWIPTPDVVPDGSPTTTTTTAPELQTAAGHRPKSGKGGGAGGLPIAAGVALAVLLVGGGGWAWYHRSSRYLPA